MTRGPAAGRRAARPTARPAIAPAPRVLDRTERLASSTILGLLSVLAAACAATLEPAAASAQDASTSRVELAIDERATDALVADVIARALATELGAEVVVVSAETPRTEAVRITARLRGRARVALELVRADGSRLRRSERLHEDPDERVETVVILAANMLRDEAGELLSLLARRGRSDDGGAGESAGTSAGEGAASGAQTTGASPDDEATAPVDDTAADDAAEEAIARGEAAGGEAAEAGADGGAAEAGDEAIPATDAPPAPTPADATEPLETSPVAPNEPFVRVGVDAQLGSVPGPAGSLELAWLAGLQLAAIPLPFLAIGVREVGGGLSTTSRYHVGGAAFVELAWRFADWGDLHGAVGVHVQYLGGGSLADAAGVAPLGIVGARLYAVSFFSVSIETELRGVVTDAFHTGLSIVPAGALLWTGGLSVALHLPG